MNHEKTKLRKKTMVLLAAIVFISVIAIVLLRMHTGFAVSEENGDVCSLGGYEGECTRSNPPSLVTQYSNLYKNRFYDNVDKACFSQNSIFYCKFLAEYDAQKYGWYTTSNNKCVGSKVYVCEDVGEKSCWKLKEECSDSCINGECRPSAGNFCAERGYPGECRVNDEVPLPSDLSGQVSSYGKARFLSESLVECANASGQNICKYAHNYQGKDYGWYMVQDKKCEGNTAYQCSAIEQGFSCWQKTDDCGAGLCVEGVCTTTETKCHNADLNFDGFVDEKDSEIVKSVANTCTDLNNDGYAGEKDANIMMQFMGQKCEIGEKALCEITDLNTDGVTDYSDLSLFNENFNINKCQECADAASCIGDVNKDNYINQLDYYLINQNLNEVCGEVMFDAMT